MFVKKMQETPGQMLLVPILLICVVMPKLLGALENQSPISATFNQSYFEHNSTKRWVPLLQETQRKNHARGLLPEVGVCGPVKNGHRERNNVADIDEHPWTALLEYSKPGNRTGFHCGGVLINKRYIVTAASCVKAEEIPAKWNLTSVRLGEWNTQTETDCQNKKCSNTPINVAIEKLIIHENYNPKSVNRSNDIALLRLARNVSFTDWIRPLCLQGHSRKAKHKEYFKVNGWGLLENGTRSDIKLNVHVQGVNLPKCNAVYGVIGISLEKSQYCAVPKEGYHSCTGDAGNALIGVDTTKSGQLYNFLFGIVSFGLNPCMTSSWPVVHTRVSSYKGWIQKQIAP
ncbi:CLIP domain-containing serine protease 2-like [Hermetia illucens]|nr:CLIP domain-containing serine protease 2-like [Hermetia illucens]